MGNDISTNQALQLPPLQLDKIQQLIPKNSEINDLVFNFNDSDNTAFVTGNIVDYAKVFTIIYKTWIKGILYYWN